MSGRRRYCEADDNFVFDTKVIGRFLIYALKIAKKCNFAAGKKFSHHAVDIF